MNATKFFTSLTVLLFFSGCATQAQQQMNIMKQAFEDSKNKNLICRQNIKTNPSVSYTLNNIVVEENNSSNKYTLLASNQKLNKEMKTHFIAFLDENSKCRSLTIENISKVHSSLILPIVNFHRKVDVLYGKLLASQTTIGEFNRQLQETRAESENEFNSAVRELERAVASNHYNEIQSRQQAAAALQNWSAQQQQIYQNQMLYNNLNRPRTTNCNMLGNSVNCTSY